MRPTLPGSEPRQQSGAGLFGAQGWRAALWAARLRVGLSPCFAAHRRPRLQKALPRLRGGKALFQLIAIIESRALGQERAGLLQYDAVPTFESRARR
eukprot:9496392-Pyramimonas_sp.AAC.1